MAISKTIDDLKIPYKQYYLQYIQLIEEGLVWAFCPKCKILLNTKEVKSKTCQDCGKFDCKKLILQSKTNKC